MTLRIVAIVPKIFHQSRGLGDPPESALIMPRAFGTKIEEEAHCTEEHDAR
jgi:hypothetical protein